MNVLTSAALSGSNTAVISPDGRYRYLLTRQVGPSTKVVTFILLNPSTADAETDARRSGGASASAGSGATAYSWSSTCSRSARPNREGSGPRLILSDRITPITLDRPSRTPSSSAAGASVGATSTRTWP